MFIQTTRTAFWFASFLLPLNPCLGAKGSPPPAELTISVYNDANVPANAMASAEATAARIFRSARLKIHWALCTSSANFTPDTAACEEVAFPSHLHVRILSRSRNLTGSTFGLSYLSAAGIGCYADIFFVPISELHARSGQEVGPILGHVLAHEVAHLLLGTNSHSDAGIMRAQWQRKELLWVDKSELLFTQEQSQVMRRRLLTARQAAED